jgi:Cu-Zn family superoxide dismutase
MVKMSGADSVIGKAIVIHADMDDLGRGGDDGSITTGITEIHTTPTPLF